MVQSLERVLDVMRLAERLKFEYRHSWLSNGHQESVAEHTWRMGLFAILLEPYLPHVVDIAKLLKMIIIHDLVEAVVGDVAVTDIMANPQLAEQKQEREQYAMKVIQGMLDESLGAHLTDLWYEFEVKESYEAKVANAIDKLEVQLQHNHADLSTWEAVEYGMSYLMGKHTGFDTTLDMVKDLIEHEAEHKMQSAGIDISTVKPKV